MRLPVLLLTTFLCHNSASRGAVRYVKPAASGSGNCTSWANACTLGDTATPGTALYLAQNGDEIWVKSGTYGPIALKNGVKVYGGFAGTEALAKGSKPDINVTIIDGGGVDPCVTDSGSGPSTVLRGFTLRNGYDPGYDGGGAILLENSSALVVQCVLEENRASDFGGAASVRGGSPQFVSCIFRNNGQTNGMQPKGGGAVYAYRGSPTFTNCLFHGNQAGEGGVVLVVFGTPTFINCTMTGNHAKIGYAGAIFDQDGQATIKNSIIWDNTTTKGAGYADNIYAGGGGSSLARYSNIQGGWPGTNIISADPQFEAGGYHLTQSSPCVDTAENAALPPDAGNLDWDIDTDEVIPKDLATKARTSGPSVDMGAYEVVDTSE
jgi:hypothetical protein